MFEKILIPLDGSELSEVSLKTAVPMAEKLNSKLILTHVIPERNLPQPSFVYGSGYDQFLSRFDSDYEEWAENYLNHVKEKFSDQLPQISIQLMYGNVANQLLEKAKDVDLIVISTHGYSGFSKWILGSVTERIIGHATCPVWVVKGERPIGSVLLSLDGSEYSEVAIDPALTVAAALKADLTCLHVIEPLNDVPNALIARLGEVNPQWDQWIFNQHGASARNYFNELSLTLKEKTDLDIKMVLRKDTPAVGILNQATDSDADLIVMSTHGRSGMSKWLLGSVTEKVLQKAPCHLLIIRPFL